MIADLQLISIADAPGLFRFLLKTKARQPKPPRFECIAAKP
jgi:hypothetical protein